ncbi:unnamed protein product [Coregonus sp. 'balchen']|nr:unnamed protein product [Coregonus sp. 'balchen']
MSVYTLNLRVFWPLLTCVLTGLVLHHHITHWLSSESGPESGPDPGYEAGTEPCSDQGPPLGDASCSDGVRNTAFHGTFYGLHLSGAPERSRGSRGGQGEGAGGLRLTRTSVPRLVLPPVPLSLDLRLPFRAACARLRHTPAGTSLRSHSMAIRRPPRIPSETGLHGPMETKASLNQHQDPQSQEKDLWTIFFPRQEQRLLGWLRGRSPQPSCHLKVLQLTKALRDLGGQALDSNRGALWRSVLSSYTLKTAWLRLLLSSPAEAWEERHLVARMEELVRSLRDSLQNRALDHLFLGSDSGSILPDSVALPKLVKEAVGAPVGGPVEGSGGRLGGSAGNLWAGVDPASLDLVSGRLAYAWTHLHRLIRLGRPQRSSLGLGRAGNCNGRVNSQFRSRQCNGRVNSQFRARQCNGRVNSQFRARQCNGRVNSQFRARQCNGRVNSQFSARQCNGRARQCNGRVNSQFRARQCNGRVNSQFRTRQCNGRVNSQFSARQCNGRVNSQFRARQCNGRVNSQFRARQCNGRVNSQFRARQCNAGARQCNGRVNSQFRARQCNGRVNSLVQGQTV